MKELFMPAFVIFVMVPLMYFAYDSMWVGNCALHRPLADCKVDYEKLHR